LIGARLGPYEVVAKLGAGGMGEVWRARDTRLEREVALKVLPPGFADDPERHARFEREAKVLASLNHPHIATLHALEHLELSPGHGPRATGHEVERAPRALHVLVMELVEGEDLAQRISRGSVPLDEAIPIARQIAEALEAAHEHGIVHRDLKPANVKVRPDGTVKVLDFGLAKAWERDAPAAALADSPTVTGQYTRAGQILGTAAYMSPEQARGGAVDGRADVWAFGVVLFEMLAGRRPFDGATLPDLLTAVLTAEPPWAALPAATPDTVRTLIARCLTRDPRRRLQAIAEARIALESVAEGDAGLNRLDARAAPEPAPARHGARLAWTLAAAALLAALALAWALLGRPAAARPAVRLTFEPPEGVAFDSSQTDYLAVSPNGRMLVFSGRTPDGRRQLWLRALDSADARPLPDSNDALEPFWSPDSRSLAFGALGKLKRLDLGGGRPRTLADAPRLVGGTWSRDGVILFVPDFNTEVFRVAAEGGAPAAVTRLDTARQETGHRSPSFLPDGRRFLYGGGKTGDSSIFLGSLDSLDSKLLVAGAVVARFAPPHWLLFHRGGELWAQRCDARRLELQGDPLPVSSAGPGAAPSPDTATYAQFSVSENGVLVWRRPFLPDYQLVWFDRSGARLSAVGAPIHVALTMSPKLSPDGRRVVIQNREPQAERLGIWVIDLEHDVSTRLSPLMGQFPQWSPDGGRVGWLLNRQGAVGIYEKAANGVGDEELLLRSGPEAGGNTYPSDWSVDGRFFLYATRGPKTGFDIWALALAGDRTPHPVLATESDELAAQLSPDGRWIAYRSDASGTYEIYLQSFTADGRAGREKWRISTNGGAQPRFRADGRELFYIAADGRMMAVALDAKGTSLEYGTPKPLFETRTLPASAGAWFEYDVARDGQRFLVGTILDGPNAMPPSPTLMLDWTAALGSGAGTAGGPR
jgi:Tol biopolymer transport system component